VSPPRLLVTCEHGGNRVPSGYRGLFDQHAALLQSHRGYDPGSLRMAQDLAEHFGAPLIFSTTTRLLVDLNRSPGHPRLFSEATRGLPRAGRDKLVEDHHQPYRSRVERRIGREVAGRRRVVHLSSHSFTPILDGAVRNADVGLLYDPARPGERALARRWQASIRELDPAIRVRLNYPYAGKADGLTTHLRRLFPSRSYVGIELEINQRHPLAGGRPWSKLRRILVESMDNVLR
jgi:predicted N-formylglutamate amidohydrolase